MRRQNVQHGVGQNQQWQIKILKKHFKKGNLAFERQGEFICNCVEMSHNHQETSTKGELIFQVLHWND